MDNNAIQRMQDKLAAYLNDLMIKEGMLPEGEVTFAIHGKIRFSGRTYWLESKHDLERVER